MLLPIVGVSIALFFVITIIIAISLRRVVSTNEVHIVQSRKTTSSYGKDTPNGNTYYEWPSWVPVIGINRVTLPVSVFDIDLKGYEAYDKGRVPFVVDVKAFFRINDSNLAAQRVSSFAELHSQLTAIVQGAVRTIMANAEIEHIMEGRSIYGEQFTKEVAPQLANWGVTTVKNIELMDIRDHSGSRVIENIMAKKKSLIEMESRKEVARNMKDAQVAEIDAKQQADIQLQVALQAVGMREAEKEQQVGIANQQAQQLVKEQERMTMQKHMDVIRVNETQKAEIEKGVKVIHAQQNKETTVLVAEGNLEAKKRESEGITLEGQARAEAEKAMQLAPVQAQITLAKEIGENQNYQQYLVTIRRVEAGEKIGIQQALALKEADIKIIANAGEPVKGISTVMDLFSAKGGTEVGAMLEAVAQSDQGKNLMNKIGLAEPRRTGNGEA